MEPITSLRNPKVKALRSLRLRKHRQREGRFLIEGIRVVEEALNAGAPVEGLVYAPELLVSDRAIGADQGGNYLLAVTGDNTVEKRPIRMGQLVDGLRVIEEGLQPGELVVVKGVQRARPGAKVDPAQIDMKTLTASAIKAAAEAKLDQSGAPAAPSAGGNSQGGKAMEKTE